MRSNVVFVVLLLLLGGLVAGLVMRAPETHEAPIAATAEPLPAASASGAPADTGAVASASATVSASASAAPAPPPPPPMDRPLRVMGLGWELVAPGVMANGGVVPGSGSFYEKQRLDVVIAASQDASKVENALARGGKDPEGADIAILPLPRFVASYERLKALHPVIFFVVGYSDGREVVLSNKGGFDKLPRQGKLELDAAPGSAAAFLALYAFDLAGVNVDRVDLTSKDAPFRALTRRQSKAASEQVKGDVLLTTGEAAGLIPHVAIAQTGLVESHPAALTAWAEGWLEGQRIVASDASEAARTIAKAKGAPEPLTVLADLGTIRPASLADCAHATGLSGRGAATLEKLFEESWRIWREAKILSVPPERAPVDGSIVASLVRAGAPLDPPATSKVPDQAPTKSDDAPLITHRIRADELDVDAVVEELGTIAGVFPRSPLVITVHPAVRGRIAADAKETKAVIDRALERFDLPPARLRAGKATGVTGTVATVAIMPVP
ncbi:MAG: hypothetical protein R3B72_03995 [Polyangiaceae bacterium]